MPDVQRPDRSKLWGWLLAVGMFVAGVVLAFRDQNAGTVAVFSAAGVILFFSHLGEFRSFKGWGMEAELKEKIKEANDVLANLRQLAVPISETLMTVLAHDGRFGGGVPRETELQLVQRIEDQLREIGVGEGQIDGAKSEWHRWNLWDMSQEGLKPLYDLLKRKEASLNERQRQIPPPVIAEDQQKIKAIRADWAAIAEERKRIRALLDQRDLRTVAEDVESLIRESSVISDDEKPQLLSDMAESLADIKHYGERRAFRRLDAWLARSGPQS